MNNSQSIYTALEDVALEIASRWNNLALKKEVASYLGEIPHALGDEPKAVLFRNVITHDYECQRFLSIADSLNMKPLGLEFVDDKFCTRSADKVCLGRMAFLDKGKGDGQPSFHYRRIIDLKGCDSKKFHEINTTWGEPLVAFHHRSLGLCQNEMGLHDMSSWLREKGGKASVYYQYFLALFLCNGVLLENFVTDAHESKFADEVVFPAIEKIQINFGIQPLIVPIIPRDELDDVYWWCYPVEVEGEVDRCLQAASG